MVELCLHKDVVGKGVPEVKADFEKFIFRDIGELNDDFEGFLDTLLEHLHILIGLHGVSSALDEIQIPFHDSRNRQCHLPAQVLEAILLLGALDC